MAANGLLLRRARPLLGTLVSIQLQAEEIGEHDAERAAYQAFAVITAIHRAMSAHEPGSDLARLAQARPREPLAVSVHTVAVLRLAQHWSRASNHAFDAQSAGETLARSRLRPALAHCTARGARLAGLRFLDACTVLPEGPMAIDLGGIAKGYAVDQAVAELCASGVASGLVNAGGDLRAFGPRCWPIELQHPIVSARTRPLLRLRDAAIASSVASTDTGFVPTRRRGARWTGSTVLAPDCATADALTKWALQDAEPSLQLRRTLRAHGARLWRT
ncbi:FAD:protein FMN transferase [Ramlibacter ginsenosidimutans]|uniref:FAD:protein FMN transferase n=1 Tax=Ramlibacter ginsenosidimutans TaxID=502333 RepID=A0A934TX03_9BURK|nr:FAD:protein FMN transferase [Ramlibacter ginsenosidimutans]MBK6008816.1 FAD:protein FMN transferase [Ramlibacter ginsenosidimutans]